MPTKCTLLIADLFPPPQMADQACEGLALPALGKILARASSERRVEGSLESALCRQFGMEEQAVAPLTLQADGVAPGNAYWLRADPVHLRLQGNRLILRPAISLGRDEAEGFCASLNAHFAPEGLHFLAPHPQRWYVRPDVPADAVFQPVSQVSGRDISLCMPHGKDALRWHRIFNETQMLLHEHPVNRLREARGETPVNSVWMWGGGLARRVLSPPFFCVAGDGPLGRSFALAAGLPFFKPGSDALDSARRAGGDLLFVVEGPHQALMQGDVNAWQGALQELEQAITAPLWAALLSGKVERLTLDAISPACTFRFVLTRGATWRLWRNPKPLVHWCRMNTLTDQ